MPAFVPILVGLATVVGGAELIVRYGSRLASRLKISPTVVGLTIVSLGTSAPELAVGINAALAGRAGIAVGNIVGTNIVNLLLILGVGALIQPIALGSRSLRLELPAMVIAAGLLFVMSLDGQLSAIEGWFLMVLAVLFTFTLIRASRRAPLDVQQEYRHEFAPPEEPRSAKATWGYLALTLVGIVVVVIGAELLVRGAVELATSYGVTDEVIGLTIVAIGTSAPELVTTIVSSLRGDPRIAIGNLLGSSIYNIALILGVTMVVSPVAIEVPPVVLRIDMIVMVSTVLACVPAFWTGRRLSRGEGAAFAVSYLVYLTYLIAVPR
ncbi:MAG: calcium/sodium antiporter [Acidobacteriota bacterium]|nr:calcium/sodium antiporter [Acidobacteriota bacterium]